MWQDKKLNKIDQEFFDLTKNFDLNDWRVLRTEHYWWTKDPFSGAEVPRSKYEKLELIRYYISKGTPKA
jgi:hypothetical protein